MRGKSTEQTAPRRHTSWLIVFDCFSILVNRSLQGSHGFVCSTHRRVMESATSTTISEVKYEQTQK